MLSFNSQALISESITLLNGLSSKLMQRLDIEEIAKN